MSKFTLEAKLGIFVIACVLIAFYTSTRVLDIGDKGGFDIKAKFRSVEGLVPESQVQIAGIKVGTVSTINLDPESGKVIVSMDINNAYRNTIPEDSRVLLRTKGLLGDKYVAIEPGKPNARKLEPGEFLTLVYEPTDTEKIFETVGIVAQDLQALTREARKKIIDQKGAEKFEKIIDNTDSITSNLNDIMTTKRSKIDKTIDNIESTSDSVNKMIARNRTKINDTVDGFQQFSGNIDKTGKKFEKLANQLESISRDVRNGRGTLGKLVTDEDLYRQADALVRDLRGVTNRIQYGGGTIGRLINDPEMYFEARRAVRNMNKTAEDVSEATPISTLAIILGSVFR
jgi:phospholipid/cholesterol/gamma-HCH transport system substrate-binding protein